MENTPKSQFKISLTYGIILGLALIINSVLFYAMGKGYSSIPQNLGYVIMIVITVIGIKNYRDKELGGFISYGKSLGTGVLIMFIGGIISTVYFYIFITQIDTDFIPTMLAKAAEKMQESGLSDEKIEKAMAQQKLFMSPNKILLFGPLGSAFMGLLFSLIISIFMKKKDPSFESNFQ
jgi:hypothetical protein